MQRMVLLLVSCLQLWLNFAAGTITQPPVSVTAPLNTNVSFTCQGAPGDLIWSVNRLQIADEEMRDRFFPPTYFYIPLRRPVSTEMFVIGLDIYNNTSIRCTTFDGQILIEESDFAFLTLYGFPYPPTNLDVSNEGTDIVLTWNEPFSISGEDVSYVVTMTNVATGQNVTQNVTGPRAVISEPLGERDCSLYEFVVLSRNGFGVNENGTMETLNVPTVPNVLRSSEIQLTVSLLPTVSLQVMFRAPNPCEAYLVMSYNISFMDQIDSSASFSTTESQTFEDISFIIDAQNSALQKNRFYLVTIAAINSAGSSFSEQVPLYTTGLQSSSVVLEVNDTASVTCNFALGSDALGCEVSFYVSTSMELLFAQNITREPSSGNTLTKNIPLMGSLDGRAFTAQVAELQVGGAVSVIAIPPQVVNVSAPTTSSPDATTMEVTEETTSSVGITSTTTTRGGGGGSPDNAPLGGNLYIVIGVAAAIILMFLLLIIIAILVICSLNSRKRIRHKAELARMNSLKDNNAYGSGTGTLPVSLTSTSPLPNGISRNNTYYEKSFEDNLGATNGNAAPLYETIANKKDLGASNGALAPVVPNPVYGSSEPKSPLVVNPIYAEAQPHVSKDENRTPKEFVVDVSALNPVYSGLVTSDQFSSSNESTPVRKNFESAVPLPALQDTGPRYGNAPLHAGPGIPASAALDLIKASEHGTPLRRATGSPPPSALISGVPIYEEVKHPKSRTLSSSDHVRPPGGGGGGLETGFPMRSMSHTDGDRNIVSPPGFPLMRNESYGMIVGSDVSSPTSPQPHTPTTSTENGGTVQHEQQRQNGTSVESLPPPIPVKSGSLSSSNPGSPTLTSERVPSEHTSP